MKPEKILDRDFGFSIQEYLFEKEKLEWEGEPHPKFSITLLESEGNYDVISGPANLVGFLMGAIIILGFKFYLQDNWLAISLTLLFGFVIFITPDILKHQRKKKTKYAFTKNRAFFQLWRLGKTSIHFIDFTDVGKITYQEYEDKSGIIHFLPKKHFDFYTYDFVSGKRRFYPTFEMVPDVVALQQRLEHLRKERSKAKTASEDAV